jgi:type IV pilus assembly protein PilP
MIPRRALWVLLAATALLGGCSNTGTDDLEEYVTKVKARVPGPIDPLPEIKQIDTFVYEPRDRRDPFVADERDEAEAASQPGNNLAPDPLRRKEELEGFALDSLRMVGTLEQNESRWGLIRSQDGTLHRVRVGNYMGQNNGQITSIGDESIELTEVVSEGSEWRERQAKVTLTQ